MVQMHFESVVQGKPRIRLNDLSQHTQEHIRRYLVTVWETNAHHLIMDILSVANS